MEEYIINPKYHIKSEIDYSLFSEEEIFNKIRDKKCDINNLTRSGWFSENEKRLSFAKENISYCMRFPLFIRTFLSEIYCNISPLLKTFIEDCYSEKNYWLFIFYSSILDVSFFPLKSDFCKIFCFCSDLGKVIDSTEKYSNFNNLGANWLWQNRLLSPEKFKKEISFYLKKPFLARKKETLSEFIEMCF